MSRSGVYFAVFSNALDVLSLLIDRLEKRVPRPVPSAIDLIDMPPACTDVEGGPPLYVAIWMGHDKIAMLLIEKGANVNYILSRVGQWRRGRERRDNNPSF